MNSGSGRCCCHASKMNKIQKTARQALITFKSRDPTALTANFEKLKALVRLSHILRSVMISWCTENNIRPIHSGGAMDGQG